MTREEMKARTKKFALRIIRLVDALPRKRSAQTIGGQLLRAGTSVGSNYRAACRGRSEAEFVSKLGIVEEEADESLFWTEVLVESGIVPLARLASLMKEAEEILRIVVSAINTTRRGWHRNPESGIRNSHRGRTLATNE